MSDLLAARAQMAMSLAFHIVFAAIGIALPAMMTLAEWRWLRTNDHQYLLLAKRWAKGMAILFAVGAVSGTVLSFELGLLWPAFMEWSGPLIGPLFALEGFAFFAEAIFLGMYLYGWSRMGPKAHLTAGFIVTMSGIASAWFVVTANAWMNVPVGFELADGHPVRIDPLEALWSPHAWHESLHMVLAAFAATGFLVAGIHAFLLLRQPTDPFHRYALGIALSVGSDAALLQPLSGHLLTQSVAHDQPAKLAAIETLFQTRPGAPFHLGGIPDERTGTVHYSIEIPYALSLLLHADSGATVPGLDRIPRRDWPQVAVVHLAFQFMVAAGLVLVGLSLWCGWRRITKKPLHENSTLLRALVVAAPLGFLAIEAGWAVTEVGRQPWIVYQIMRTSEAVTPMPGLWVPLATFTLVYGLLSLTVVWTMWRHIAASAGGHRMESQARL
jgi:cytochrome d ubiquinol oxidase subunit I